MWNPLRPELCSNESDNKAANGADAKDWDINLRDDRRRQAKQDSDRQANQPSRTGNINENNNEADREPVKERAEECCTLIRKRHWQHHCHCEKAEDETAQIGEHETRHSFFYGFDSRIGKPNQFWSRALQNAVKWGQSGIRD
jgi:hypothetical protein